MSVSNYLKTTILKAIKNSFGECEVILFGSRANISKSGGDFDIAIKCTLSKTEFKKAKVKFFKKLLIQDLDLPIDLISYNHANTLLKKEIDSKGIKL